MKYIIISKISVIVIIIILEYISKNVCNNKKNKIYTFKDILPKISPNTDYFPSLKEIFMSRHLYINDADLTSEYIRFIKPVNENEEKKYRRKGKEKNIKFDDNFYQKRKDQYDFKAFGKLCYEEKLISPNIIENNKTNNEPLISVILPTFNKEFTLMKSIRSIQNQSLKNIEIIIVDDCSTDNSQEIFKNLLETDSRIRIFSHSKNLGVWRSRIDGFLYSNAKYIIHFDPDDMYEDNYVLEDAYNIISKYNIDSIKMLCRFIYDYNNFDNSTFAIVINDTFTKIAYQPNIDNYNRYYFNENGWIWSRLTRKNILSKSLNLLSDRVLNIYKNFCEDQWWNILINRISFSYLIIKRYSYLYFKDGNGEGDFKNKTESQRDKMIQEFLYFLYLDYDLFPKDNDKKYIIDILHKLNDTKKSIQLNFLRTKFYILDDLLNLLIKDSYVTNKDKLFLNQLLHESRQKQDIIRNTFKLILR